MPNSKFSASSSGGKILNSSRWGFTLLEIVIVLGILTILSVTGVGFWQSFRVQSDMDAAARNATDMLRRAQNNSITGENFAAWGVHFESSSNSFMQLFSGTDWAGGTRYDYFPLSSGVQFSNPAPGAAAGDTVEIEISANSDVVVSDSSTISGAPAAISGTTTLQ